MLLCKGALLLLELGDHQIKLVVAEGASFLYFLELLLQVCLFPDKRLHKLHKLGARVLNFVEEPSFLIFTGRVTFRRAFWMICLISEIVIC